MEGTGKRWCGAVTYSKAGKSLSVSGGHPGQGHRCDVFGTEGWAGGAGDRGGAWRQTDNGPVWGDSDPQWLLAAQQFPPGYMASSLPRFRLPRQSISTHAGVQTPGTALWGSLVLGMQQPLIQGGRYELG